MALIFTVTFQHASREGTDIIPHCYNTKQTCNPNNCMVYVFQRSLYSKVYGSSDSLRRKHFCRLYESVSQAKNNVTAHLLHLGRNMCVREYVYLVLTF